MSQLIFVILFILVIIIVSRVLGGRHYLVRKLGAVVTHYYPPVGLMPAQGGYIWDDRFDARDLMSTLYDRSVRGLLSIHYQTQTGDQSESLIFHKIHGDRQFTGYEHTLWTRIWAKGNEFSFDRVSAYGRESHDEIFDLVRLALGASCTEFYGRGPWYSWQTFALNEIGAKHYHYLLGYYDFIDHVETDKLQELVAQDPLFIDKTLPWAVMFGLDTAFSRKLETIELIVGDRVFLPENNGLFAQISRDVVSLITTVLGPSHRHSRGIWSDAISDIIPHWD